MSKPRRNHPPGFGLLLFAVGLSVGGCQSLHLGPQLADKTDKDSALSAPAKHSFRVSQYVFLSDFEINRNLPLFHELASLREQVYKELQLPPANTVVQVYLFENQERYERFMRAKYPDLPKRRAFFVAQPRAIGGSEDLLVYTYWGNRIQQDLRHELTHALLHSVLKEVPLWLDEGLAEYFELPPGWKGVNYQHLKQLRSGPDGPYHANLVRLEKLQEVQQMTPAEYREAWAWVHLMLHANAETKKVLVTYLNQLRMNSRPAPLRSRLAAVLPDLDDAFDRYLARLDSDAPAVTALGN
jgi:hypothetical protein